jgi:hypothetical protein
MLSNKVLSWPEKLWKDELCWDEGGCGDGDVCCVVERFFNEEEEIGEGRGPGHILNITDGFTDEIISSVNLSTIMSV